MDIAVRLGEPTDAPELPIIEHDAAQVFRAVEGLEWIAREAAGGGETYLDLVEAGTVWVADAGGALCGFLAARVEGEEFISSSSACAGRSNAAVLRVRLSSEPHSRRGASPCRLSP